MKQSLYLLALIAACFSISKCAFSPDYSPVPELTFTGMSKNVMNQGLYGSDSLEIYVDFKDGDGDIGLGVSQINTNIFLIDSRTDTIYDEYKIPVIPEQGANNGVEGSMIIKVFNTCCIYPRNLGGPCDTTASVINEIPINELSLGIYMIDRAGNKSNVINTTPITLRCKT